MEEDKMIEKIETKNAPAAIGPYSQAVKANGMVFASGQIPIDPATGNVVEGTAADQAKQVFKNIEAVLEAAGTDKEAEASKALVAELEEDIVTVDGLIAFAESEGGAQVFGAEKTKEVAAHAKEIKAADAGSVITEYKIRWLIKSGRLRAYAVGSREIIVMESFDDKNLLTQASREGCNRTQGIRLSEQYGQLLSKTTQSYTCTRKR